MQTHPLHIMEYGLLRAPLVFPLPHHRFLVKVTEGYQACPYHSRTHAADVLRTAHVIATRAGMAFSTAAAAAEQDTVPTVVVVEETPSGAGGAAQEGGAAPPRRSYAGKSAAERAKAVKQTQDALSLLTFYLAAVVGGGGGRAAWPPDAWLCWHCHVVHVHGSPCQSGVSWPHLIKVPAVAPWCAADGANGSRADWPREP